MHLLKRRVCETDRPLVYVDTFKQVQMLMEIIEFDGSGSSDFRVVGGKGATVGPTPDIRWTIAPQYWNHSDAECDSKMSVKDTFR
jgi:hypothetical protein